MSLITEQLYKQNELVPLPPLFSLSSRGANGAHVLSDLIDLLPTQHFAPFQNIHQHAPLFTKGKDYDGKRPSRLPTLRRYVCAASVCGEAAVGPAVHALPSGSQPSLGNVYQGASQCPTRDHESVIRPLAGCLTVLPTPTPNA